ncbi:MAG: MoxR family ATPase [Spirochaetes bacterium]|nr:MoxR family ATPase [Spirochaetota bacterium]
MEREKIYEEITKIKESIKERIKIRDEILNLILICFFTESSVLLDDVPGVGKTTFAKVLAASCDFDVSFKRIQFTADLLPYDILGIEIFNKETNEFVFKKGPIFSNIVLADEINRGNPKVQSALLEAMGEKQVTIFGKKYELDFPFFVIGTQNPIETEGTFPLPEATLDRFTICTSFGYPQKEDEFQILKNNFINFNEGSIRKTISKEFIKIVKGEIDKVYVDDNIINLILKIGEISRNKKYFNFGFSPRALLHLLNVSKGWAFFALRDYVIDDDIKNCAYPVFNHRIKEDKKLIYKIIEDIL